MNMTMCVIKMRLDTPADNRDYISIHIQIYYGDMRSRSSTPYTSTLMTLTFIVRVS